MNPCPDHRESITLLAAGGLGESEAHALLRHVEGCAGCRQHLARMRRLCAEVTEATHETPGPLPSRFHSRLVARVREDAAAAQRPSLANRFREWFSVPRLSLAAACLIFGLVLILRPGHNGQPPQHGITAQPGTPVSPAQPNLGPTPPPTLLALSRAWSDSAEALDSLLVRQQSLLAAADPPSRALGADGQ